MRLRRAAHDEQVAFAEQVVDRIAARARPQPERPPRTERHRRDADVVARRAEFGLVVRMPPHRVVARAIQVAQHGVVARAGRREQLVADRAQRRRPGRGVVVAAAVAITKPWFAAERHEPRHEHFAADHADRLLRERQFAQQCLHRSFVLAHERRHILQEPARREFATMRQRRRDDAGHEVQNTRSPATRCPSSPVFLVRIEETLPCSSASSSAHSARGSSHCAPWRHLRSQRLPPPRRSAASARRTVRTRRPTAAIACARPRRRALGRRRTGRIALRSPTRSAMPTAPGADSARSSAAGTRTRTSR